MHCAWLMVGLLGLSVAVAQPATTTPVTVGSVMDLSEQAAGVARELLVGIQAAIAQAQQDGLAIRHVVRDDKYDPQRTALLVGELLASENIVALVGNTGTANAIAAMPTVTAAKIPSIGYYTGADALRPGTGLIVNYRPSYSDEVVAMFNRFVREGALPQQVCLYLQNDGFGLSGIDGLRRALSSHNTTEFPAINGALQALDAIDATPDNQKNLRNGIGPVGFYDRNLNRSREGFESLRDWERSSGQICRAVIIVASQDPALDFIFYSRKNRRAWGVGLISVMNRTYLERQLRNFADLGTVYFSQVVPPPTMDMPLLQAAHQHIGAPPALNNTSLEGYIVGRLTIYGIQAAAKEGPVTGERIANALLGQKIDLDGLQLDFTKSNQGSQQTWLWRFNSDSSQFELSE